MIRPVLYFLLLAAVATGFAWFADQPGSLTVDWLGYEVRTSVFIAAIVLVLAFAALLLAGWLGVLTWTAPRRMVRRMERRRIRVGQEAVRRGIFAAGAGDRAAAMKAGAIAKKNVPDEPLALLLEAQSAQLNEDAIGSRQAFERMLEKPEMAELGLRGLFIEAKKGGQMDAAKQFAERALAANPALAWPSSALFEMQCREGDWRAALRTLGIAKQNRHLGKAEADRRRALLLTQLAIELEETEPGKALAYSLEAFGLSPTLIPAASVAGRILASQGNSARATKLLTQAWRTTQHPELALIYAHARPGDSPRDRLARVKALVAAGPASLEGDIAVAVAAIEAKDWQAARLALEPHLATMPPARVCRLMARIEAGQNRDSGRAREWLARAARGAPDPIWVAPDGAISADWRAISPLSGALGAFEWKTPHSPTSDAGDIMAEMSALELAPGEPETILETPVAPLADEGEPSIDGADDVATGTALAIPQQQAVIDRGGADAKTETGKELESDSSEPAAVASQSQSKTDAAKVRPNNRKLTIFVPGPAPDDPGPRPSDEEGSTPLSRYRGPV
jgi:HemY protein